ncbi:MAG: hypothetical protein ABFC88_12370 [Thermoguttaceae bacterium]
MCPSEFVHEADRKITTGPYDGELRTYHLCRDCADKLWNGTGGCVQALKNLVTANLNYFLIEPIK